MEVSDLMSAIKITVLLFLYFTVVAKDLQNDLRLLEKAAKKQQESNKEKGEK